MTEDVTEDDVRAAALQYVRKISGFRAPSRANADVFEAAVGDITAATERLLVALVTPTRPLAQSSAAPQPSAHLATKVAQGASEGTRVHPG